MPPYIPSVDYVKLPFSPLTCFFASLNIFDDYIIKNGARKDGVRLERRGLRFPMATPWENNPKWKCFAFFAVWCPDEPDVGGLPK